MKTVLILHGIGGHAGIHWQQWLHDELEKLGYKVLMPNLSNSDHPDRQTWLSEVKDAVKDFDPTEFIIVGHSLGVTSALDFIEQSPKPIKGLISVSGFADDYSAKLNSYFLVEKTIDFTKVRKNLGWSEVLYGDDDPYVTQSALLNLAKNLRVEPVVIENGGHLNTDSGYLKFPQLIELLR